MISKTPSILNFSCPYVVFGHRGHIGSIGTMSKQGIGKQDLVNRRVSDSRDSENVLLTRFGYEIDSKTGPKITRVIACVFNEFENDEEIDEKNHQTQEW